MNQSVLINPYYSDGTLVTIEEFDILPFTFVCKQTKNLIRSKSGWLDVSYQICLGSHKLKSYISEWSTDWDMIRHDMEHLVYHNNTIIELNYEDEPTRIVLHRFEVLDRFLEKQFGTGFAWVKLMKIEIFLNEFEKKSVPFAGFAYYADAISNLYHGLLSLAEAYPETNVQNREMTKSNVHAKLTSPLLENHIKQLNVYL